MVSSVSTVDYPPRRVDLQKDTGWRCWVYKNDQQVLVRFEVKFYLVMVLQDLDVCHIHG